MLFGTILVAHLDVIFSLTAISEINQMPLANVTTLLEITIFTKYWLASVIAMLRIQMKIQY